MTTKGKTKYKQAHTDNTKYGMGDNYGTGIKAKMGKIRDGFGMYSLSPKQIGTAPKSVV